jgi:SAM-dependent methyltransferase
MLMAPRLRRRRLSLRRRDYLTYRALWPALEAAVARVLAGRRASDLLVLDLGCGERPYADLFADASGAARCIGIDRGTDGARPDIVADAQQLPLVAGCVDLVFCSQVLEHVTAPAALLAECARVLRPGGALVLSAPFWWPLHEEPHDHWRFSRHGLDGLARRAGLQPLVIEADCGSMTAALVALIEALPRWALPLLPLINLAAPALQALSPDRRSTLNWVLTARRPAGDATGDAHGR